MAHAFTVGQVAAMTGIAAKTIRYYEEIGVLPLPGRTAAGYRQYAQPDVDRIRFVGRARALGLPLERLRLLAAALHAGATIRPKLRRLVHEQLIVVQREIGELELLRQELERVSERMRRTNRRHHRGACRCLDTDAPTQS